jgi:Cys-tRNA(Pro) deacylase
MASPKPPVTPAVRELRRHAVEFVPHLYAYVERGGAAASSAALGIGQHQVIKTLVMETDTGDPLMVLMHGDTQVSTKALARRLGVKLVRPCEPTVAERHTGYRVGGTSPFGTRRAMPTYVQWTIADLDRIWINGGKRGFLVEMAARELLRVLQAELVDVAAAG